MLVFGGKELMLSLKVLSSPNCWIVQVWWILPQWLLARPEGMEELGLKELVRYWKFILCIPCWCLVLIYIEIGLITR